jgi:hypothetical protein
MFDIDEIAVGRDVVSLVNFVPQESASKDECKSGTDDKDAMDGSTRTNALPQPESIAPQNEFLPVRRFPYTQEVVSGLQLVRYGMIILRFGRNWTIRHGKQAKFFVHLRGIQRYLGVRRVQEVSQTMEPHIRGGIQVMS